MLVPNELTAIEFGWNEEASLLLLGILSEAFESANKELETYPQRFWEEKGVKWDVEPWVPVSQEGWGFGGIIKPYAGTSTLRFPAWSLDFKTWTGNSRDEFDANSIRLRTLCANFHVMFRIFNWKGAEGKLPAEQLVPNLVQAEATFAPELGSGFAVAAALFPPALSYLQSFLERSFGYFTFVEVPIPSRAMQAAHTALEGEELEIGYCSRTVGVFVNDGRLLIHCAGDRSDIYVPPDARPYGRTGSLLLDDHNIDCAHQQLVALAGLAALSDEIRKDMND